MNRAGPSMHWPCLLAALLIMFGGTLYPLLFEQPGGGADHGFATALFFAMSAGMVRGVGFVPRTQPWRALFSGWACLAALLLAAALWLAPRLA